MDIPNNTHPGQKNTSNSTYGKTPYSTNVFFPILEDISSWHDNDLRTGIQRNFIAVKNVQRATDLMRATLSACVGSKNPFCIKKKDDEVLVTFIRGFADPDRNIVLISEKMHSLGMNILEIKNIQEIAPCTPSVA